MWQFVKREFTYLHGTFHDSETILWSRIQMGLGAAWLSISQSDLSQIITNPKWFGYWVIFNAFVTEMLRRSREDFNATVNSVKQDM